MTENEQDEREQYIDWKAPDQVKEVYSDLTWKERKVYKEMMPLAYSRREYVEGLQKLNYQYIFSNGDILNASEDENGIASVVIKRDDKVIVNFQDIVPNYKFITPTYLIKQDAPKRFQEIVGGNWNSFTSKFMINVGDMRDPRSIMLLMHEIGHCIDYSNGKHNPNQTEDARARYNGLFKTKYQAQRQKIAKEISNMERDAWVNALKIARDLKTEKNVNLFEGFANLNELQKLLYAGFMSYRMEVGEEMIASDEGLVGQIWEKIKQKFVSKNSHEEQWKYMEELFDKGKLRRKTLL